MKLTPEQVERREEIIRRALAVDTREEIAAARADVAEWLDQHPDDPNIDWALETVWMIEHCIDLDDAEQAQDKGLAPEPGSGASGAG